MVREPFTRWRRQANGVGYASIIVAILAWNAWRSYLDLRPLPKTAAIADWLIQKRFQEAADVLRQKVDRSPHDGNLLTMLARSRVAQGDSLGAALALHEIPRWWPGKPAQQHREAAAFLAAGRAKDAEAAWTACLAEDLLHPIPPGAEFFNAASTEFINHLIMEGRRDEAREIAWRLYQHAAPADHGYALRIRMEVELKEDDPGGARPQLRRFIATTPDDWHAKRALAVAEQALGNPKEANRLIAECLAAHRNDPLTIRDYLAILLAQDALPRLLTTARNLSPPAASLSEVWKYRGIARERTGDLRGAARDYREAGRRRAEDLESVYRLARVEQRLGMSEQAAVDRKRAAQIRSGTSALFDTLHEYVIATTPATADSSKELSSAAHLATICEDVGWQREAEAWKRVVAHLREQR